MGVKITQSKPAEQLLEEQQVKDQAVAVASSLSITELEMEIDELVLLTKEMEEQKPKLKRMEDLRKKLQSVADESEPTGSLPVALTGTVGAVVFQPKSTLRTIKDMNGMVGLLKSKLGYETLLTMLSITLGNVDKYLSASESEPFIGTKQGSRTLEGVFDLEEAKKKNLL